VAAGYAIKHDGASNDLLDRIANDPRFNLTRQELDELLANSCFTGMAVEQTESYVAEVRKVLAENKDFLAEKIEAKVNV
jgi:adenylosuccinate lyase